MADNPRPSMYQAEYSAEIANFKEEEKLSILNHSCAHLLAQAVKHLYPNAKFWVGPVIEEGFYYDIDLGDDVIKTEDLEKIEKTVESAIDAAKQEISLDEKIDESLVEDVKNRALREGEKRVQHLKEKIENNGKNCNSISSMMRNAALRI